jgi:stage IV sporulation protein B
MEKGSLMDVSINGVKKGLVGEPGEIKGFFDGEKLGAVLKNTNCGVFGFYSKKPREAVNLLPIGLKSEIKSGKATLVCTLDENGAKEYEIELSAINYSASPDSNKCFTVKVTDPALLEITGGIVQGMSGSPIIQNGKLVGAVTHVLINDPTTGYGIFIENMLTEAEKIK